MAFDPADLEADTAEMFSRLSCVPLRDRGLLFGYSHVVWDQTERTRIDPEYRARRSAQRLESYHRNKTLSGRFMPGHDRTSTLKPPSWVRLWVHAAHPEGI